MVNFLVTKFLTLAVVHERLTDNDDRYRRGHQFSHSCSDFALREKIEIYTSKIQDLVVQMFYVLHKTFNLVRHFTV